MTSRILEIHRFDPSGCGFPPPLVPVLPTPAWGGLRLTRSHDRGRSVRSYVRGRYALRAAYELAGVGPKGALLAPSYHCRTMIDPALARGAEVQLYRLLPDLQVDLDHLETALRRAVQPVRALLATHYFGVPRDLSEVAAFCERRGIVLIEDCAHAFLAGESHAAERRMGSTGRYVVSSFYKFVPSADGALLWARDDAALPAPLPPPSLVDEMKAIARLFDRARRDTPPPAPDGAAPTDEARELCEGRHWIDRPGGVSASYLAAHEERTALRSSLWMLRHTDVPKLRARRRARHAEWVRAVASLPGCRPLFPALDDDVIPYMFALHVDDPQRAFPRLKQRGVPIWRWDEMAVSDCPTAAAYRLSVLHLPCHQQLSDAQMQWMTGCVAEVLSGSVAG